MIDPKGYVYEGRGNTGAAAVGGMPTGFHNYAMQARADWKAAEAAKAKYGSDITKKISEVKLPYWDAKTQAQLKKEVDDYTNLGIEMRKRGTNPDDLNNPASQAFFMKKQKIGDLVDQHKEQKTTFMHWKSELEDEKKRVAAGQEPRYDIPEMEKRLEKYYTANTIEERSGMNPNDIAVYAQKQWDVYKVFDRLKGQMRKDGTPYLDVDEKKITKEQFAFDQSLEAGQRDFQEGKNRGLWNTQDEMYKVISKVAPDYVYSKQAKDPKKDSDGGFTEIGEGSTLNFSTRNYHVKDEADPKAYSETPVFNNRQLGAGSVAYTAPASEFINQATGKKITDSRENVKIADGNMGNVLLSKDGSTIINVPKNGGVYTYKGEQFKGTYDEIVSKIVKKHGARFTPAIMSQSASVFSEFDSKGGGTKQVSRPLVIDASKVVKNSGGKTQLEAYQIYLREQAEANSLNARYSGVQPTGSEPDDLLKVLNGGQ